MQSRQNETTNIRTNKTNTQTNTTNRPKQSKTNTKQIGEAEAGPEEEGLAEGSAEGAGEDFWRGC